MENTIKNLMNKFDEGNMSINDLERELLVLHTNRHSTSRKGTGWYMIFITALSGLLGGMGWYHIGIEVGIFTLLVIVLMLLASIRYNQ